MRKKWYVLIMSMLAISLQLAAQQALVSGGDTHINSSGTITHVVGEVAASTYLNKGGYIHEGVLQNYFTIKTDIEQLPSIDVSFFPNPVQALLTVSIDDDDVFDFSLFDIAGTLLLTGEIEQSTQILFADKVPGVYILTIQKKQSTLYNSYSIIKK